MRKKKKAMYCWQCEYFECDKVKITKDDAGRCKRNAPSPNDHGAPQFWPGVEGRDWCGQFKERQ